MSRRTVLVMWSAACLLFFGYLVLDFASTAVCFRSTDMTMICDGHFMGTWIDNDRDPLPTLEGVLFGCTILGIGLPTLILILGSAAYSGFKALSRRMTSG